MRSAPRLGGLILTVASVACQSSPPAGLVDAGGTAGSGSTGAVATSGASGGTSGIGTSSSTGGTSSNSSTTGGTSSGSSTGGTSGGSTTSGPPPLPQPCVWVGDVCAVGSCTDVSLGSACVLDGGGLGTCYSGECQQIDLQHDPNNCGWYGVVCPTDAGCQFTCIGFDCSDGGGCGPERACDVDGRGCVVEDCSQSPNDAECAADAGWGFCCNGNCFPRAQPQIDPFNCGGCGIRCPLGYACDGYGCLLVTPCAANQDGYLCSLPSEQPGQCCAGSCTDISSDPLNCGACGLACPTGSACQITDTGIACTAGCLTDKDCPTGYTCLQTSPGQCWLDSACGPDSDGTYCFNSDSGPSTCCHGQCGPFTIDTQNCGSCGVVCPQGEQCDVFHGICTVASSCQANYDYCPLDGGAFATCCGGQCVDLNADPLNCGQCDLACPNGSVCASRFNCSSGCATDNDCPNGDRCTENGPCVPASCDGGEGSACFLLPDSGAAWGDCCDGVCTDTLSDSQNCDACGEQCPVGLTCVGGACAAPDGGYIWDCSSVSCPSQSLCLGGKCLSAICAGQDNTQCPYGADPEGPSTGGFGLCCGATCIDPGSDPQNCGGCGIACPSGQCVFYRCVVPPIDDCLLSCGTGTICAGSVCIDSTCQYELAYCLAEDGTVGTCCPPGCANLDRDPQNCGTCGISCPSGMSCENGLCGGLAACGPGHAGSFCDLDAGFSYLCCPGQGCIDTASDPANCGACDYACGANQTCIAGACI